MNLIKVNKFCRVAIILSQMRNNNKVLIKNKFLPRQQKMGQTCSKCQSEQQSKQQTIGDQSVAISYENGNFILPNKIPFQTQSTYAKIERAAYNFCQQNRIDLDFMPCITRIIAYRQEKVFLAAFNKTHPKDKENFLEEVTRIPQDLIDLFYHNFVNETQKKYSLANYGKKKNGKMQFYLPKYINTLDFKADQQRKLYQKGKAIIQDGEVALVIMCAGSSSRFDNEDKFITPLNLKANPNLTLLDMIFIRLQSKIDAQPPIIITCNQLNFTRIQNFFRQRSYFGMDKQKFRFMEVECLPVLDINGKYCIDERYKLIKRPFGTGRTVNEILKERNMIWLNECGVKYVHFIGAENLVEQPCDELMLGIMISTHKRIMAKCSGTASQWQKLPRYVASKNNQIYIKYWNQLNSLISQQALYSAYKYPVATNSIMIQLSYLKQLVKDFYTDIYLSQNYHIIRRREKMMSVSNDRVMASESLTFEGDIRDLLACCKDPGLLFVERNKSFTPIFSKKDQYSMEASVEFHQNHLTDQYRNCKAIHQFISPGSKFSK